MRLLTYLLILSFLSSCTTIEVTKEVVKVGNVVKGKVEKKLKEDEAKNVEASTIVEEQKIIIEEKEEEKSIVKTQQELAQINFIGKRMNEIQSEMGEPKLSRSDGAVQTLRYDSTSCRLFLFFNLNSNIKRVEHFEFRDYLGELLNTKKSLETCYKEYKLIS
tara:strand:+ start:689 stop:1174 length:486 start_codon:yes stop_codon:yes gene_type:complete